VANSPLFEYHLPTACDAESLAKLVIVLMHQPRFKTRACRSQQIYFVNNTIVNLTSLLTEPRTYQCAVPARHKVGNA
jgi:hypothetical protein